MQDFIDNLGVNIKLNNYILASDINDILTQAKKEVERRSASSSGSSVSAGVKITVTVFNDIKKNCTTCGKTISGSAVSGELIRAAGFLQDCISAIQDLSTENVKP